MLIDVLPRMSAPSHGSLQQCTKNYQGYLEVLVIPEDHDDSSTCNDVSSGTIQSINGRNTPYFSLALYLASNNHLDHGALGFILDYAMDLIARGQFEAVFKRSEPTVRALLDLLLSLAGQSRRISVIKAALSAGAYPDVRVDPETTALMWASKRGDTEMMGALLNAGADAHMVTYGVQRYTALGLAAGNGSVCAVELLLAAGGTSARHAEGALHDAVKKGEREICTLILNASTGLDVNSPAEAFIRSTCLEEAVLIGRMDLIELLIQRGAEVNAPADSFYSATALQAAALKGNIDIAKYLLQLGADVNQKAAGKGKTAIQWASQRNNKELCIMLLNEGADINAPAAP